MSAIDLRLNQTVGGKYRIVKFLAEGGMGSVYEAQHLLVKRRFAVKFLRSDLLRRRDVLARFKLEAEAAGALESENIAAVLDFGIAADGAPYIVMEYLDGIDLGRLLSVHGPLPPERAADLVYQACSGAQRAHEAGVLHRDLKPRNLLLCRRSDGTDLVKIVDFGVAKLQAGEAINAVTRTGGLVGTPSYMSPEQARGEPEIDARTDVYALGVILYELLSGRTPHPGDSYNAVLHHIATQPALGLESAERELPPELNRIVERALAPDLRDRQASAAELGLELAAFARRKIWSPVLSEPESEASARCKPSATEPKLMSVPRRRGLRFGDSHRRPEPANLGAKRRMPWPIWLLTSMSLGVLALFGASWSASRAAVPRMAPSLVAAQPPPPGIVADPAQDVEAGRAKQAESAAPSAVAKPSSAATAEVPPNARAEASKAPHPEGRRGLARPFAAPVKSRAASGARFDPQNPYD
jgi:eukaryotic-like serine/threonine-protein kinase